MGQVGFKVLQHLVAGLLVGGAEDGGGMEGGDDFIGEGSAVDFAAVAHESEGASEEGFGGGGSEAEDDAGLEGGDLSLEPGAAGGELGEAGVLVDAELAALHEFEVLDGVGDEEERAVDVELGEGAVQELAGWTDEGEALEVFLIAGLFSDDEQGGVGGAAAGDYLGRVAVEVAAPAGGERLLDGAEGWVRWDEGLGGLFGLGTWGHGQDSGLGFRDGVEGDGGCDFGVVGAPEVFQLFFGWCGFAWYAGGGGEGLRDWIPGDDGVGSEDRPAEDGEALGEEGSGKWEDAMFGLVPGDEVLTVFVGGGRLVGWRFGWEALFQFGLIRSEGGWSGEDEVVRLGLVRAGWREGFVQDYGTMIGEDELAGAEDFAELHKDLHLVYLALDLGGEAEELRYVGVGFLTEQDAVGLEAVENPIEEVPAVGIPIGGGEDGGFEEGLRGVRAGKGSSGGGLAGIERESEGGGGCGVLEIEILGRVAGVKGLAGGFAPGFEVGLEENLSHGMVWRLDAGMVDFSGSCGEI